MARTADKPGTYRIRPKGYGFVLSGVKADGTRVRVPAGSEMDAMTLAGTLFPGGSQSVKAPTIPEIAGTSSVLGPTTFDDWGLPTVTAESAQSVASAMGIPPVATVTATDVKVAEASAKSAEIQANRKKTAKSLSLLIGHGYAMGVVMGSQRLIKNAGKTPVNPAPKQVADLAECTKDTITEMFGDHEVKPWIMMVLLSVGIPISMWIQSPKALKPPVAEDRQSPDLRSVT